MDIQQQLLQVSAKLYKLLESVPNGDVRDKFIQDIDQLLDERGKFIELLVQKKIRLDIQNKDHLLLKKLDEGIKNRLENVMQVVKQDLKNLQKTKKHEKQYMNPYASIQVMDGMYYDKKK
ncbi:flagellar protein FliT [Ureibacillus thermophilus]|uniref:flagellar protein FliT n=1 Tax=Ureibacillus thermophilus TaxID=367743 RepID=UPI003616AF35